MWTPIPQLSSLLPELDLTLAPTENPHYALLLPLLVLITTWGQQKLTMGTMGQNKSSKDDDDDDNGAPAGGQAAAMTKSMTTIMPIMFGFFSLSFSVGLSIYFVTSNLIGVVQYSPQGKRVLERVFRRKSADEPPVEVIFEDEKPPKKIRKRKKKKPRKK